MKFLIAGTGSNGNRHTRIILETGAHQIAICDMDNRNLKRLAAELSIDECYESYQDAIIKSRADAVIACTPNVMHAPVTIEALNRGCHVLCEKPMATELFDAHNMLEAERVSGKVLMIGYTLRMNRALQELKCILERGDLGKIISARINLSAPDTLVFARSNFRKAYETGGGIIYDYSHELDYSRLYFGEAKRCACLSGMNLKKEKTIDDNAEIIVEYKSGALAHIHMDYMQQKGTGTGRNLAIVCEKGFVESNFQYINIFYYNNDTITINLPDERDNLFKRQTETFLSLISGKKPVFASGEDGYRIVELCKALYRSAENSRIEVIS